MPLELIPTLENLNLSEVEEHLKGVRVRRLLAQIEYKKARNVKLGKELHKIELKLEREVKKLGKLLETLIVLEEKVKNQLSVVTLTVQEQSFTRDQVDEN